MVRVDEADRIMTEASEALLATDYLRCEQRCMEALSLLRAAGDFERYARVLLPLQEARRQRRQIAAEAGVVVLAGSRRDLAEILQAHPRGCLLLVYPPYTPSDGPRLRALALEQGHHVEALALDGADLLSAFEQQMERRGDAALAAVNQEQDPVALVDALAQCLEEVGDHEIAHQRLAAAARAAARKT